MAFSCQLQFGDTNLCLDIMYQHLKKQNFIDNFMYLIQIGNIPKNVKSPHKTEATTISSMHGNLNFPHGDLNILVYNMMSH